MLEWIEFTNSRIPPVLHESPLRRVLSTDLPRELGLGSLAKHANLSLIITIPIQNTKVEPGVEMWPLKHSYKVQGIFFSLVHDFSKTLRVLFLKNKTYALIDFNT